MHVHAIMTLEALSEGIVMCDNCHQNFLYWLLPAEIGHLLDVAQIILQVTDLMQLHQCHPTAT